MVQENDTIEIIYECFLHIYNYPGQLEDIDIQNDVIGGGMLRGDPPNTLDKHILVAGYQIKAKTTLNAIQIIVMELYRLLPAIEIERIIINEL